MENTIIKGKIWKAGTGTYVIGISKRDVEYYGFELGELVTLSILSRDKKIQKDDSKVREVLEKEKKLNKGIQIS